jgi:hypothetical protein
LYITLPHLDRKTDSGLKPLPEAGSSRWESEAHPDEKQNLLTMANTAKSKFFVFSVLSVFSVVKKSFSHFKKQSQKH